MERIFSPELAQEEMEKHPPVSQTEGGIIIKMLKLFPGVLSARAIAKGIGWKTDVVRVKLSTYKAQGKVTNARRGTWKLASR